MSNVTNWTAVTDTASFLGLANTTTGGWFWIGMLFMVFVVLGISLLKFGFEAAILSSGFATLVIGMMFAYMGLIGWSWILMILGILLVVMLWIGYSSSRLK